MKRTRFTTFAVLIVLAMFLTACGPKSEIQVLDTPTEQPAEVAARVEQPVSILPAEQQPNATEMAENAWCVPEGDCPSAAPAEQPATEPANPADLWPEEVQHECTSLRGENVQYQVLDDEGVPIEGDLMQFLGPTGTFVIKGPGDLANSFVADLGNNDRRWVILYGVVCNPVAPAP